MSSPDASKRLLQLRWLGADQVGDTIMGKLEREAKDMKVRCRLSAPHQLHCEGFNRLRTSQSFTDGHWQTPT